MAQEWRQRAQSGAVTSVQAGAIGASTRVTTVEMGMKGF